MLLPLLVLIPAIGAAFAYTIRSNRNRALLLPLVSTLHLALVLWMLAHPAPSAFAGWLHLDPLAKIVLLTVSVLYFCCSLYAPGYLALRPDRPSRVFCACLLFVLGTMSLVIVSQHLGLLWVGMEATSLLSAPLLFFNRTPRSLEAAWKYLLLCSVGIALALLGSFFLAYAALVGGSRSSLLIDDLTAVAPMLSKPWLHAAFATLVVGYGTKMGLAPMHSWKPDAYGEAPGLAGAVLAGGLTSCAFCAILRFCTIMYAAGESYYTNRTLIMMGLISMAFAAVFVVRQQDYKRMLAYSSVEHMGILVIGIGLGGIGVFAALLHLMNNAFIKGVLFLSSGNIHRAYNSKSTHDVSGALRRVPISAALFLAGFFAITGSPPFGAFISEFTIARAAFENGRGWVGVLYLATLLIVFMGMGTTVLAVVQGTPSSSASTQYKDTPQTVVPILILAALALMLGLYIPTPLITMLQEAARYVEGTK